MERNLLEALVSLSLKRAEDNTINWHLDNGDMTSQAAATSFWNQRVVFATSSSPRDPRHVLYMHKTIKDGHLCNDVQILLTQKLNSCPAKKVGPLTLEQLMRNGDGSKGLELVGGSCQAGRKRTIHHLGEERFNRSMFLLPFLANEPWKDFKDEGGFSWDSRWNEREGKDGFSAGGDRFVVSGLRT